jgi:hypothetical protein
MRNGQNKHRMRGRSRGGKSHNPLTRVYESNGPDVKIRGTANHIAEKYIQLARDATASGDPVAAENYYQHAEHYFRLIAAAQEQFRQNQPYQPRESDDSYDGDDDAQPNYEPHSPQPYPQQQQQPREAQPYQQREQPYPRDQQQNYQPRQDRQDSRGESRNARQNQQANGTQGEDNVGGLPSFITGAPAPGAAASNGDAQPQGERFPSRRGGRRRDYRGPRNSERVAAEGADDAAQPTQPPAGE